MLVKLPPLPRINDYEDLYFYVVRKIPNKRQAKINIMAVALNPENALKVNLHIKEILRKKNKRLTKHGFDMAWGYHYLGFAPCEDAQVPLGYAEIDVDKVYLLKRKD